MMSETDKPRDDDNASDSRQAVVDKVLDGADAVTRRKMDAMLDKSSVVEVMAQAHGSGRKSTGVEDRPIKPDFLNTDQYQLARKAIGAKGEPIPADRAASVKPTPPFVLSGKNTASAQSKRTRRLVVALALTLAVMALVAWWWQQHRASAETPSPNASGNPSVSSTEHPPAAQPANNPAHPAPQPPATGTTSAQVSASAEPPQPTPAAIPGPSPTPRVAPSANPSTPPTSAGSGPRFPVQGDD